MNASHDILAAADQCVMCGLCLPHCPTYRLHRSEAESPRGRIALMQALESGRLEESSTLRQHLDSCLVCRACERMCPSKVRYGELITTTRAALAGHTPHPKSLARLLEAVVDIEGLKRQGAMLRTYQRSGLQWLSRKSGLLKGLELDTLEAMLPELPAPQPLEEHYPAIGAQRGHLALFTGCIGNLLEGAIHRATIKVLTRLGFEVIVPRTQGCCGSLHHHNGEAEQARHLAQKNVATFGALGVEAVVSTASGCAAHLADYPKLYEAEGSAPPFVEICSFLASLEWPDAIALRPLQMEALLHLPCTQRNALRDERAVPSLLSRIPGLRWQALAENELCCGAAGSYLIAQPQNATALRERKLKAMAGAKSLISNNLGCALHLQNGLRERGEAVELLHPVQLIARALP